VVAEIRALRARGAQVIACSVRHPSSDEERDALKQQTLYFTHVRARLIFRSLALAAKHRRILANIIKEAFSEKSARLSRRLRALVHTALGIYFAALIEDRAICHVHVHHGYFASWIAMVAARVLNISYSITFHGSDLLLHGAFLKTKLEHCRFCTTISEFNRTVLVSAQPTTAEKIFICRMGVRVPHAEHSSNAYNPPFSVVRLHLGRGLLAQQGHVISKAESIQQLLQMLPLIALSRDSAAEVKARVDQCAAPAEKKVKIFDRM
jgi:hypothetical protein